MFRNLIILIFVSIISGCATVPENNQPLMSASFYNMKKEQFSLKVVAPKEVIREYAICKAVWFAEHKKALEISLGNPAYSNSIINGEKSNPVPNDWIVVDATAYISTPNPDGNPFVKVKDFAENCRNGWEWYQ